MTQEHPHAELSGYIDGALEPAAQAAVEAHLVTCAVCRPHVVQLRATASLVGSLPDPVPSRRLVPRLGVPAWLAPLRTLMTLASGAAVFLFIASALVSNITFLASGGATTAQESSRDTAVTRQAPAAAPIPTPSGVPGGAPASTTSPNAAFSAAGPTSSPTADNVRAPVSGASPSDQKRLDQTSASGSPQVALAQGDAARATSAAPERAPLLNPWLWLALAVLCGAIAIALHRRLHPSV